MPFSHVGIAILQGKCYNNTMQVHSHDRKKRYTMENGTTTQEIISLLENLSQGISSINEHLNSVTERFDRIDMRLDGLDNRLDKMDNRLDKLEVRLDKVENRITSIETHIENTIIPHIQLIAESHIDLSRKLDNAIEQRLEREMLKMRVEVLEQSVKRTRLQ